MSLSSSFAFIFAQATSAASNAAAAPATDPSQQGPPAFFTPLTFILILGMAYFALIRPQSQAKKKQEETIKAAKTGDKIVTTSGIHGVITNVKDTSVIVRIADNVKIELEKTHIDKITRADSSDAKSEKPATAKA